MSTIKTLGWLKQEAEKIASSWNGSDEKFVVEDTIRTDDDAMMAVELLELIQEVDQLTEALEL